MPPATETLLDSEDELRLAETFRLARTIAPAVWPSWERTLFPIVLVTADHDLLIGTSSPPSEFESVGHSPSVGQIFARPRQFDPSLTAAFPAFGSEPVVVIGQAEAIEASSRGWVLTVLHEHFHQFQMCDPSYYSTLAGLELAGSDETGMWMLNYPFPYRSTDLAEPFAAICRELAPVVALSSRADEASVWGIYKAFLDALAEPDRRYMSSQVWQEGVARYVELRCAELAAVDEASTEAFQRLPGPVYAELAETTRQRVLAELQNPDLARRQRASFYAVGAGLALLLDHQDPTWKGRYLREMFRLERCAG